MEYCGGCLNSEFISEDIAVKSTKNGDCQICGSKNVALIGIEHLHNLFNSLIELYKPHESGELLISLLKKDWLLFGEVPDDRISKLLHGVKYGDENLALNYISVAQQTELFDWISFKEELKHVNRFFPTTFPQHDALASLISYLSAEVPIENSNYYRARIQKTSKESFPPKEMGAPPKTLASNGRANPFGISYLYVASTENTAVSEVRPHNNEYITIANFIAKEELKLVDLRSPRKTIVPFRYSEASLKNIYQGLNLLEMLGEELTKPVSQSKAQLEYLSSQYLCEFIKSQGYDGVTYESALGDGDNYAIFDEQKLECISIGQVKVTSVKISHDKIII
ncbi:RES family NAD+ phosphorylase [Pseudoalteromonas aliena]|uniref:RES domain-containing protein n=1 Tax=Pseudoalteromonas aliena SW19 TaxID=1314866 RepID=A0ABR9DX89_9GAMM|nr:RES family NAD+ phosphorylase [Pseudoalteromonas aliena]MBE0358211.1 hypothetical protein [Pseudoalteromonas aliena SW19]